MRRALSLTSRDYHPLPNRYEVVHDRGKDLVLHIPAARDKAMLMLYSYGLDPIAEATADKKSFSLVRGGRPMMLTPISCEISQQKMRPSGLCALMSKVFSIASCTNG